MTIDNLKTLKALLKLARAEGVESMRIDNVEFHLGYVPEKSTNIGVAKKTEADVKSPFEALAGTPIIPKIETPDAWDSLTDEQKLFYSAQGEIGN